MSKFKRFLYWVAGYRGYRPLEVEDAYTNFRLGRATPADKELLHSYYNPVKEHKTHG